MAAIHGQRSVFLQGSASLCLQYQFPHAEVEEYERELNKLVEELKEHGIHAYETTGTTEEKLAEMVGKMQFTQDHPEPAPKAETLIGTLLRRNLLWVALIKEKWVPHSSFSIAS